MRLPLTDANDLSSIDIEATKAMVDTFMQRGFTYFDTAYPYHNGHSEAAFRQAVAERYPREAFTVTSKMPCWLIDSEADMERIFTEQLQRCGVDYFDYYWLHALNHDYYSRMQRVDGFGFIARKKAEGKIRHIGFSFHSDSQLLTHILDEHPEAEFVQLQINYVDWDSPSIEAGTCYDICQQRGKPVIVMEPVKGGSLARVPEAAERLFRTHAPQASAASWAIRYAASLPGVMVVLSGMSNQQQIDDNTAVMQDFQPLTAREQAIVAQAGHIINDSIAIPCTACHYCTEGCPQQICIPEYFELYNKAFQFGDDKQVGNSRMYYNVLAKSHSRASECIQCGQCEEHCPQGIDIIDSLQFVAKTFE